MQTLVSARRVEQEHTVRSQEQRLDALLVLQALLLHLARPLSARHVVLVMKRRTEYHVRCAPWVTTLPTEQRAQTVQRDL